MIGYHQMIRELMTKPSKVRTPGQVTALGKVSENVALFTASGIPIQPPCPPHALIYGDDPRCCSSFEDMEEVPCEILFELDGWQIERYEGTPVSEVDWISHDCPVEKWRYRIDQWQLMNDGVCPACCEAVPDDVMGIWKLKNFDKLPELADTILAPAVFIYQNSKDINDKE